ncbi:MAG TPA: alkaline phosphatase family protein [Terriglobia bacterium]|nr:alkaline phosphatase family protein [Terriglobia bacterium]
MRARAWVGFASAVVLAVCAVGCQRVTTRPVTTQVVVLGFDGADPTLISKYMAAGRLPNLARLAQTGTFKPLGTTNPPESPVAWASFATGLNPGGTGIFDFLKRDPRTYLPRLALVEKRKPEFLFGLVPIRPPEAINERHGTPFYAAAADAGYKVTVLRMPLEFPPTKVPGGRLLAGLGLPDVRGTWGTFFYFGTDLTQWDVGDTEFGGELVRLTLKENHASARVDGPVDPTARQFSRISVPIDFTVAPANKAVNIRFGDNSETLSEGQWSNWFRSKFAVTPFLSISAVSRFYVLETSPDLRVYMSPLNIDPVHPILPISYPADFSRQLAKTYGLYKTVGWWHDTWALNEERIGDGVFLQDCWRTTKTLEDMTLDELRNHPPSLMVSIFTFTDSVQHMFFRLIDPQHPRYDPEEARKYGDAILQAYEHMDEIVGEVLKTMKPGATLIIVSDHGFHTWRWGFNTNTWLVQNGYMTLKNPNAGEKNYRLEDLFGQGSFFPNVDWSRTRAYALGLGQVYLNERGREANGIVNPGPEADHLLHEIQQKLLAYSDPDNGQPVLQDVYLSKDIDHGPYMKDAPDLQLNFQIGYRTSWQTALGAIPSGIVVANTRKWSGDHCASDPSDTPGIFLCNRTVDASQPSILDIAPTVLKILGAAPPAQLDGRVLEFRPVSADEAGRQEGFLN